MDFTKCELDLYKTYSGKETKKSIIYNGKSHMLKFRWEDRGKEVYSDLSEFLGCSIYKAFGLETQNVILGEYEGKDVVVCENFLKKGEELQEFSNFTNSYSDTVDKRYSFSEIIDTIENHPNIFDKKDVKEKFWKMYVMDAFLGNFDRHGGNWGFVVNSEEKYSKFAPIYDCGSCLYPQMSEKEMDNILKSDYEIKRRVFEFPNSQIVTNETRTKSNYFSIINSLQYEECNESIEWFCKNLDFDKINNIIESVDKLSKKRKNFYKTMLKERYDYIIKPAHEKIKDLNDIRKTINDLEEKVISKNDELRAYTEELNNKSEKINEAEKLLEQYQNLKNNKDKE